MRRRRSLCILPLLVFIITHTAGVQGRENGDSLEVGDVVRLHLFVEEDYWFRVVACGTDQCGGVRVEGVDARGMGFQTFVSDPKTALRPAWVLKQNNKFGNSFRPGSEYTFFIVRPAEQELNIWLEGKEEGAATVHLKPGPVQLYIDVNNGIYRFLSDEEQSPARKSENRQQCSIASKDSQIVEEEEQGNDTDILAVSIGCRYEGFNKDISMCIVYLALDGEKGAKEVYRSEISRDKYNPHLRRTVKLPLKFDEHQILTVAMYSTYSDCDTPPEEHLRGTLQTPLAVVNRKGKVELSLSDKGSGDSFSVEFALDCNEKITLDISAKNIEAQGDVFLRILKSPPIGSGDKNSGFILVADTPKVERDIHFLSWGELTLSVKELCDGDHNRPLKIYALEDNDGTQSLIGYFNTTVNELKQPQNVFLLINNAKKVRNGNAYNNSGEIYIGEVPKSPTFSQYMAVGFELVGTVQIDFTASNNGPTPSLHHQGDDPNQYELAIQAVGDVVEKFISDGVFKAYGFGADLPGWSETQYDFNLNLSSTDSDYPGVKGVLAAYRETVGQISFSGPTNFAPGIQKVVELARKYQDGSKYFVHLLLTDGMLHDSNQTKLAIQEASDLPISIIMVGIGDSNFADMKATVSHTENDSATVTYWKEGERGTRDIVQVVAMKDFGVNDSDKMKRILRKKVLSKIPPQFLEFMRIRKIPPKPPRNTTIVREC